MSSKFNTYASILVMLCVLKLNSSWSLFPASNEVLFQNSSRIRRQATCGEDSFRCQSGECIDADQECDGPANCKDESDETESCKRIKCAPYSFTCKYGACINRVFECDGKKDCRDNSDEQSPRCTKSGTTCSSTQFKCKNGQCIDDSDMCDGIKNCADGSDETSETCMSIQCPTFSYRCAYGACVNSGARCNGTEECADGSDEANCPNRPPKITTTTTTTTTTLAPSLGKGCLLPKHPTNGQFKILASVPIPYVVNSRVEEYVNIQLSCRNGFVPYDDIVGSLCFEGDWDTPVSKMQCVRSCPDLQFSTETLDVECKYRNNFVSCKKPIEGTTAEVMCKPYFVSEVTRPVIKCQGGSWNYYINDCVPECGRKRVGVQTLIIGGGEALEGEYPWVTGIYLANKTHICGGSIISRFYVLSAAHCFASSVGIPHDKNNYLIAAGKYYRDLEDPRDVNKQQMTGIANLYISPNYKGVNQNYGSDIAILKVEIPFQLNQYVQPVCIDWEDRYDSVDLTEDNYGVVSGWGYTESGKTPSEVLKKLTIPYKQRGTCERHLPKEFTAKYYTFDKFCAGYIENGTSVCSGDSGGGLYFRNTELKFFVRGIVSLSPTSKTGCDANQYALYTKVSSHLRDIVAQTERVV